MIGLRAQPPVHSPLSVQTLWAGVRAATSRNGGPAKAEARVLALLQQRYGARDVLLTSSGTGALTAALAAVNGEAPVALPAYACYDVATAADGAGKQVLLYDIDPQTLSPDLAQLQAALQAGARAVVVAHLYGYPADLSEVNRLAAAAGAVVIEDAAQAAGATVRGRAAGSHGSLAVLSFGRGKGLTGGTGGALLALDRAGEEILRRIKQAHQAGKPRRGWRELAQVSAQWLLQHPSLYGIPSALPFLHLGETIYRAPQPVRAAATVTCSLIFSAWALADREVEIRRRNAERLLGALRWQIGFQTITAAANSRPGYLRLPVLASPLAGRAVRESAARRLGIMPGYPTALSDLERFGARCANRDTGFPGSRFLAARLCTFPTHSRLADRDLSAIEAWVRAAETRK